MKKYIKKLKRKFFLWPIRLFGNLLIYLFLSFFFLLEKFQLNPTYPENIFIFHIPLAWSSLFMYILLLHSYFTFKINTIKTTILSIYLNISTLLSGFCWSKIAFGFFLLFDSKTIMYISLLIFILSIHLLSPKVTLFAIVGFFLLLQERFSSYFINSIHQSFVIETFSQIELNTKTISLDKPFFILFTIFFLLIV